jgi:PAS domain S-box-containing protein
MRVLSSIKGKILTSYFLLMLATTVTVSMLAYHLMITGMMVQQKNTMELAAELSSHHVSRKIRQLEETVSHIADKEEHKHLKAEHWDREFEDHMRRHPGVFLSISVISRQGREKLRLEETEGKGMARSGLLRDFRDHGSFRAAVKTPGTVVWSSTDNANIRFFSAVPDGDEGIHVLMGDIPPEVVFGYLRDIHIGGNAHAIIADRRGGMVFCPVECYGELEVEEDASGLLDALTGSSGELARAAFEGSEFFLASHTVEGTGWDTIVMYPYMDFMRAPRRLANSTIVIFLAASVLGFLIFWVITGRIASPLKRLTSMAGSIYRGEFPEKIEMSPDDEVGELASSFNQMTGRLKESTSALVSAKEFTESIINNVPGIVYAADHNARFTFVSPMCEEIFGYTPQQIMEDPELWFRGVHPSDTEKMARHVQKVFEGKESQAEYRVIAKNGTVSWVRASCTARLDGSGGLRMFYGILTDITIEKLAEARIKESEKRFRDIVENSGEWIWEIGAEGEFTFVSPLVEKVLGYKPEEVIGRHFHSLFHQDVMEGLREAASELFSQGKPFKGFESRNLHKDGQEVILESSGTPMFDDEGSLVGYRGANRDITDRVRAEEGLQAYSERLRKSNSELQEFAYAASHDLQEPLRKVMAFGDRLSDKYTEQLGEQGRNYIGRMQSATRRMQALINDLLTFSRVTSKGRPFAPVDLGVVARNVLEDLELRIAREGGSVEVGELSVIEADRSQMHQLFMNIIGNSLKFHKKDEPPAVTVSGSLAGSNGKGSGRSYQVTFRDNGIGFDEKYTDEVFSVFQRLHGRGEYEGNGIGMALCRKIAERHGGTISADSSPGEGATFIVTLPLERPKGG